MVNKCKWMVLESRECSEERKWLVRRLIELRLRVQEMRESADRSLAEVQVILGHHFLPQKYYITTSGPTYCDCCSGTIWTVLQSWYMCNGNSLFYRVIIMCIPCIAVHFYYRLIFQTASTPVTGNA